MAQEKPGFGHTFSKFFDVDLFQQAKDSVVGIDIGSSSIKVVQLRREHGAPTLETYGEIALGPYAETDLGRSVKLGEEKLTRALLDVIAGANITSKNAAFAIPFSSSLITTVSMPKLEPEQMASMIPLEARKYIPVPISEVTLDWSIVPSSGTPDTVVSDTGGEAPQGTVQVLLAAIHNEMLNRNNELVKKAGLLATFSEIETFSTFRAVLQEQNTTTLVVDIGAERSKFYVVSDNAVRMTHTTSRGSHFITEALVKALNTPYENAEELKRSLGLVGVESDPRIREATQPIVDGVLQDVRATIGRFQRKFHQSVDSIIFSGGGAMLKGFHEYAHQAFEVPATIADPFAKVDSPAFLEDMLQATGPTFSVAVGVALRQLQELE